MSTDKQQIVSILSQVIDAIDILGRTIIPDAVCKHVKDTLLLWKILISWLQEECTVNIFNDISNVDGANYLQNLRNIRNQIHHYRVVRANTITDIMKCINGLLLVKETFLSIDDRRKLEICINKPNTNSIDSFRRTEFIELPSELKSEIENVPFRDLKITFGPDLKRRKIFIHTGKHRGKIGSFGMWNGTTVYCFFIDGKKSLSLNHIVSVLHSD